MCAWYNSSWSKRKAITLTGGASGAQTDYQVKLTVTWDSDMKSDFSDLRFTKADGTTLLDAWMESHTASTSAIIWIETDTPANTVDADIYMYYGNSGASSNWDIGATMLDGDDFSGDLSKWSSQGCSPSISAGILTVNNFSGGTRYSNTMLSNILIVSPAVIEFSINNVYSLDGGYAGASNQYRFLDTTDADSISAGIDRYGPGWFICENDSVRTNNMHGNLNFNQYYRRTLEWISGTSVKSYVDGGDVHTTSNGSVPDENIMYLGIFGDNLYSPTLKVNWIFARKYAASPATYSVGSEESAGAVMAIFMYHYEQMRRN